VSQTPIYQIVEPLLPDLPEGAKKMMLWLIDAAEEIGKAHNALDTLGVPRRNPATGNEFSLAARIMVGFGADAGAPVSRGTSA